MRWFVKSHFSGWQEVTESQYQRYIENIRHGATAMNNQQREEHIKQVTYKAEGGGLIPPTMLHNATLREDMRK